MIVSVDVGFPALLALPASTDPARLVVVSHGTGSTPAVFRGLMAHLAEHGFAVLAVEHPGNNRNDNRLAGTAVVLASRPRDVTRAADWAFEHLALQDGYALIGHSLGACTGLALAGGIPTAFGTETGGGPAVVEVVPDPRLTALVLMAPATPWFLSPGALDAVTVPTLVMSGSLDEHTPAWMAELVPGEHVVVEGAGHFSFLDPFPPERVSVDFPPSQDPPGFDRDAYQHERDATVLRFLLGSITTA